MRDIAGKVAFVTGGASGIGLGLARALAARGVRLALADIDEAALARAVAALREKGADAIGIPLDVTDAASWEAAATQVEDGFGPVSILCNNAGVAQGRISSDSQVGLKDIPDSLWRMILEINVTGVFLGMRAFAGRMIARGQGGHIVNTASMAGFLAPPGLAAYIASKFAVVGLSESAAGELAPHGIGMSIVCPGGVQSGLTENTAAQWRRFERPGEEAASRLVTQNPPHPDKMDPGRVGEMIAEAVIADRLYVFTHPEYRPLVEERFGAVMRAFGASAEPGYSDTPAMLARSRNPIHAGESGEGGAIA